MKLAKAGVCISNEDEAKAVFAKCWVMCVHAAASDPMWGRVPDPPGPASSGLGLVSVAPATAKADDLDDLDPSILEFLQNQGGQNDPATAHKAGSAGGGHSEP